MSDTPSEVESKLRLDVAGRRQQSMAAFTDLQEAPRGPKLPVPMRKIIDNLSTASERWSAIRFGQ